MAYDKNQHAKREDEKFVSDMAQRNTDATKAEFERQAAEAGPVQQIKADDRLIVHGLTDMRLHVNVGTRKEPSIFRLRISEGLCVVPKDFAEEVGTSLEAVSAALRKMTGYGREFMITTGPGADVSPTAVKFIKASQRAAQERDVRLHGGVRAVDNG